MDKEALFHMNKFHRANVEKQILSTLDHPFLSSMHILRLHIIHALSWSTAQVETCILLGCASMEGVLVSDLQGWYTSLVCIDFTCCVLCCWLVLYSIGE